MSKKFYITTPIYYSSGKPHIGHAYTTILADTIARYKKLIGYEVLFQTGMDEHGQKIQKTALKNNISIQDMLDQNATIFKQLWQKLDINYDKFVRTTDDYHKQTVAKVFEKLLQENLIYLGKWSGYYCVDCEENYTKAQAIKKPDNDALYCKVGHKLTYREEESYFLKVSEFQQWILDFFKSNNDFIYPKNRIKELINSFLTEKLENLSVSRVDFDWGIKVISNNKHVIYVWLDALLNYLTTLGYLSNDDSEFKKWWDDKSTQVVHLMSKEITRFHGIYWPILLKMLNLRTPSKIISHGWIITDKGKMSKSLGNVIDPNEYISAYGSDSLRYYLVKELSLEQDGVFNKDMFINVFNTDLANNYGNMITRISGMLNKYCNNTIPNIIEAKLNDLDKKILDLRQKLLSSYKQYIENFKIKELLVECQNLFNKLNKYIEVTKPWVLFKEAKKDELNNFLSICFNTTKLLIYLLSPVLVKTTKIVVEKLNLSYDKLTEFVANHKIQKIDPIFLRIDNKEKN